MALVVKDRVKETTATTGTGTLTLAGALTGFQSFSSALSDGDTTYYAIFESSTGEFEVGLGTFTASGTTLARTTVLASSNSGSAVNLTAGSAEVFITQPATKAAYFDGSGDLVLNQDPTSNLQAATKQYVDTIAAAGIHYHDPVRVEQEGNLNATYDNGTSGVGATLTNAGTQAALVIDGVTMVLNDRVLIYEQTNAAHNGVYTVTNVGSASTNWVLTRATDADSYGPSDPDALGQGDAFFVSEGAAGAGETYVMTTEGTITFGTTDITFSQISATQIYSAGDGLTLTGTTFAVGAGTGVTVNANDVAIGQPVGTGDTVTFATVNANLSGNVTGDVTGDLTGNADTATAWATGRSLTLSGDVTGTATGIDGSGNIAVTTTIAADSVALGTDTTGNYVATGAVSGNGLSGSASAEGATFTVTSNATNVNTASTIVFRDASGNFSAGTITAALSGNATTATQLATGRTISLTGDVTGTSTSFNGSSNVSIAATIAATATPTFAGATITGDLTVDTNTLYVDSTNNRAGIGTSSPDTALEISTSGSGVTDVLKLTTTASGTVPAILFEADAGAVQHDAARLRVGQTDQNNSSMIFEVQGSGSISEAMRIESSGNVGIGTSSPNRLLSLYATQPVFQITNVASGNTQGTIQYQVSGSTQFNIDNQGSGSGGVITFMQAGSERMRIDSSGNLLVGMTSASTNNDGAGIRADGLIHGKRADVVATFNRKTSDGAVVQIAKDNTVVGSIGSRAGVVSYIALDPRSGGAGLTGGQALIYPSNNTGAITDGATDLGGSGGRFKDLYLSGSAYVGDKLIHDGDTDTYVGFGTNTINFQAGGTEEVEINTNGLFIQNSALHEDYDSLSGTSPSVDPNTGGAWSLTMSGNTTFTFGSTTSGYSVGFIIELTGNGSTVTWPSSVEWAGGTAPDAPASGETDILVFWTRDGGTTWYGVQSIDAAS